MTTSLWRAREWTVVVGMNPQRLIYLSALSPVGRTFGSQLGGVAFWRSSVIGGGLEVSKAHITGTSLSLGGGEKQKMDKTPFLLECADEIGNSHKRPKRMEPT